MESAGAVDPLRQGFDVTAYWFTGNDNTGVAVFRVSPVPDKLVQLVFKTAAGCVTGEFSRNSSCGSD